MLYREIVGNPHVVAPIMQLIVSIIFAKLVQTGVVKYTRAVLQKDLNCGTQLEKRLFRELAISSSDKLIFK